MTEQAPSKTGKLLVLGVLTTLPFAALVMWIGLSGGGRDPVAELTWLGAFPAAGPSAPTPFDRVPPGTAFEDAQAELPALLGLPKDIADRHRDTAIYEGRTLGREITVVGSRTEIQLASGTQSVTVTISGAPARITSVTGRLMKPLAIPTSWPAPSETSSTARAWKGDLQFVLQSLRPQGFVWTSPSMDEPASP